MDISLVSGLEANREDLSTVSIKEHLHSAGDFSDNCDTYCSSSLSVKLVVQILLYSFYFRCCKVLLMLMRTVYLSVESVGSDHLPFTDQKPDI